MLIHFIRYPVTTLGPGKRIGIWTQGCKRNCPKCMAGAFQDFDESKEMPFSVIKETILDIIKNNQVDGITISGGEPFEQRELPLFVVSDFVAIENSTQSLCDPVQPRF